VGIDWGRWAVVAPKDDTGLGREAEAAREVLGIGRHLAVPSERLVDKPLDGTSERRLDPRCGLEELRELLRGLEGVLVLERPNWHPRLLPICRDLGVRTLCVPNWEWFVGRDPLWRHCDAFVCCSRITLDVVRRYRFRNAVAVGPWPLPLARFPARSVTGPARVFIHNGALMDTFDRKGTLDTIDAFSRVPGPALRLIVRLQREVELPRLDPRIEVRFGNLADPAQLYADAHVAIQPSKIEGIGFLVLEALASGLPVITTNAPPMNEYVPRRELLVAPRWFKRRAFQTGWVPQAHRRLPRSRDLEAKIAWCAENDLGATADANRAWAEERFDAARVRREWEEVLP